MDEDLFVRVVGGTILTAILLISVTVGALLGDNPDEMMAWSMIGAGTLSVGAVVLIYRFGDTLDSLF